MTLLRRYGLWLVLATIAGIAGALLMYSGRSIAYSSTTQVDVESHVVANTTPVPPNMTTETQVATSGVVVSSTARALRISQVNLQPHLSAKVSGTANILSISVHDADARGGPALRHCCRRRLHRLPQHGVEFQDQPGP